MQNYLEFEKPLAELEGKAAELRSMAKETGAKVGDEAKQLDAKAAELLKELYAGLTPWQKCQGV